MALNEDQLNMIESNRALAISIALQVYNTAPHALELEELKAIAYFGLVDAASRYFEYCEKKGYDADDWHKYFTKYSSLRIRGAIYDRLRANDWATRSLREKSRKINAAVADAQETLTNAQLAEMTGLTEKEVRDTKTGMSRMPVSLDGSVNYYGQGEENKNSPFQIAEDQDTEGKSDVNFILDGFADAVRDLPFEQRLVVVLHYYGGWELRRVAELMEITDAQASALHTEAVVGLLDKLTSLAG